uniref:Structural molecule n=1 Tax=Rhizophora mucronata TaxID=61149 RepID=A0A2P2LYZ8_RHIMU
MALKLHAISPTPPATFVSSFATETLLLSPPKPTFKKSSLSGQKNHTHVCRSSVVDERQEISFTEPENQLINALIGIQGRGKSATPQQLNVLVSSLIFLLFQWLKLGSYLRVSRCRTWNLQLKC